MNIQYEAKIDGAQYRDSGGKIRTVRAGEKINWKQGMPPLSRHFRCVGGEPPPAPPVKPPITPLDRAFFECGIPPLGATAETVENAPPPGPPIEPPPVEPVPDPPNAGGEQLPPIAPEAPAGVPPRQTQSRPRNTGRRT